VEQRTQLEFGAAIRDAAGNVLHDHAVRLEVFPLPNREILAGRAVCILGRPGGAAASLAHHFGAREITFGLNEQSRLLIADSPDLAAENKSGLDDFLHRGGRGRRGRWARMK